MIAYARRCRRQLHVVLRVVRSYEMRYFSSCSSSVHHHLQARLAEGDGHFRVRWTGSGVTPISVFVYISFFRARWWICVLLCLLDFCFLFCFSFWSRKGDLLGLFFFVRCKELWLYVLGFWCIVYVTFCNEEVTYDGYGCTCLECLVYTRSWNCDTGWK